MLETAIDRLKSANEMLETAIEMLRTATEMLGTTIEMLRTATEMLGTATEMLGTAIESLEIEMEMLDDRDRASPAIRIAHDHETLAFHGARRHRREEAARRGQSFVFRTNKKH